MHILKTVTGTSLNQQGMQLNLTLIILKPTSPFQHQLYLFTSFRHLCKIYIHIILIRKLKQLKKKKMAEHNRVRLRIKCGKGKKKK